MKFVHARESISTAVIKHLCPFVFLISAAHIFWLYENS